MSNASETNGGINMTQAEIAEVVRNQYMTNSLSNFDDVTQICLIIAFAVLILFGACGNGLVCYVVAKNPNMRTPRNIFIIKPGDLGPDALLLHTAIQSHEGE